MWWTHLLSCRSLYCLPHWNLFQLLFIGGESEFSIVYVTSISAPVFYSNLIFYLREDAREQKCVSQYLGYIRVRSPCQAAGGRFCSLMRVCSAVVGICLFLAFSHLWTQKSVDPSGSFSMDWRRKTSDFSKSLLIRSCLNTCSVFQLYTAQMQYPYPSISRAYLLTSMLLGFLRAEKEQCTA